MPFISFTLFIWGVELKTDGGVELKAETLPDNHGYFIIDELSKITTADDSVIIQRTDRLVIVFTRLK